MYSFKVHGVTYSTAYYVNVVEDFLLLALWQIIVCVRQYGEWEYMYVMYGTNVSTVYRSMSAETARRQNRREYAYSLINSTKVAHVYLAVYTGVINPSRKATLSNAPSLLTCERRHQRSRRRVRVSSGNRGCRACESASQGCPDNVPLAERPPQRMLGVIIQIVHREQSRLARQSAVEQ